MLSGRAREQPFAAQYRGAPVPYRVHLRRCRQTELGVVGFVVGVVGFVVVGVVVGVVGVVVGVVGVVVGVVGVLLTVPSSALNSENPKFACILAAPFSI